MDNTSKFQERLLERMKKIEEPPRKQFTVSILTEQADQLERIAAALTRLSGRSTTRNQLIEDAVESYIEEAAGMLRDKGVALDSAPAEPREAFDTIIFTGPEKDFSHDFLEERRWYNVRVNAGKIPHIRYAAVFVSKPVFQLTHYAAVADDGFALNSAGRYDVRLGEPVPLDRPIVLGSTLPAAVRSPRYTTFARLRQATEFRDL